jgi:hypothetical protein
MADEILEQATEGQGTEQAEQPQPTQDAPDTEAKLEEDLKSLFNKEGKGNPDWIEAEEQPQINEQTFGQLADVAVGYQQFTRAFADGNFNDVEAMFNEWNPAAFEAFLEHVYNSKVASGEWVDRWIGDRTGGGGSRDSRVSGLQRQIQQLQSQLQNRRDGEVSSAADAVVSGYLNQIGSLAKQVGLSSKDHAEVENEINKTVSNDPKLKAAINSGNFKAINGAFKQAVRKLKMGDELPDDINQVKRADHDRWLDQQLYKLGKRGK